jgi:large subunit ribosomal protein L18
MVKSKVEKRIRRHKKIRAKVFGTETMPRLAVSKSNSQIIAQLINDEKQETLAYVWTKAVTGKTLKDRAVAVGQKIAELAKTAKIEKVVFDRGGNIYTGNIKALADSAREAGLKF